MGFWKRLFLGLDYATLLETGQSQWECGSGKFKRKYFLAPHNLRSKICARPVKKCLENSLNLRNLRGKISYITPRTRIIKSDKYLLVPYRISPNLFPRNFWPFPCAFGSRSRENRQSTSRGIIFFIYYLMGLFIAGLNFTRALITLLTAGSGLK